MWSRRNELAEANIALEGEVRLWRYRAEAAERRVVQLEAERDQVRQEMNDLHRYIVSKVAELAERAPAEHTFNPHVMAQMKAQLEAEAEDEPPVEGAMKVSGLIDRINEIYGEGLTIEQILERRKSYEEMNSD